MQSAIFKNRIDAGEKLAKRLSKRLSGLKQHRLKEERSNNILSS
jgi:predicted phosphoribosyltransferase